LYRRQ